MGRFEVMVESGKVTYNDFETNLLSAIMPVSFGNKQINHENSQTLVEVCNNLFDSIVKWDFSIVCPYQPIDKFIREKIASFQELSRNNNGIVPNISNKFKGLESAYYVKNELITILDKLSSIVYPEPNISILRPNFEIGKHSAFDQQQLEIAKNVLIENIPHARGFFFYGGIIDVKREAINDIDSLVILTRKGPSEDIKQYTHAIEFATKLKDEKYRNSLGLKYPLTFSVYFSDQLRTFMFNQTNDIFENALL